MNGRAQARIDQVQSEITICDRIDAVRGQSLESKLAPHPITLERKRGGCQRSRAQRHLARGVVGMAKALGIPE